MKIWGKLMRECRRVQLEITYFFLELEETRLSPSDSVSPNCYYSYLKTTPLTFWSTSTWAELSKAARHVGIWNFPIHNMGTKQKSPRAALVSLSLTDWILNFKRQKKQSYCSASNPSQEQITGGQCSFLSIMIQLVFLCKNIFQLHNNLPSTRLNLLWHKTCSMDKPPPLQPASLVGKMEREIPTHLSGAEKSGERATRNSAVSSPLSFSSSSFPWTNVSHHLPSAVTRSFSFSGFLFNFLPSTQVH